MNGHQASKSAAMREQELPRERGCVRTRKEGKHLNGTQALVKALLLLAAFASLAGCMSPAECEWQEACRLNTVNAYRTYAARYPERASGANVAADNLVVKQKRQQEDALASEKRRQQQEAIKHKHEDEIQAVISSKGIIVGASFAGLVTKLGRPISLTIEGESASRGLFFQGLDAVGTSIPDSWPVDSDTQVKSITYIYPVLRDRNETSSYGCIQVTCDTAKDGNVVRGKTVKSVHAFLAEYHKEISTAQWFAD